MKPKGKLLALFVVFGAIALVTASGAFTSTSVDRQMNVTVSNDSNALLGLAPNSSSQNGGYASFSNDKIAVDIGSNGANLDADTHINHVLNLTNNGNSEIYIWVEFPGATNATAVTLWSGTVNGGTQIPETDSQDVVVSVGETISISIQIDTRGTSDTAGTTLVDTVRIHAQST